MRFAEGAGRCLRSSRMERGTQKDAAGADTSWRRRQQGKGKGKGRNQGAKNHREQVPAVPRRAGPEFIRPLVEAVQSGEITVSDIQLAFKRALSETMEKR